MCAKSANLNVLGIDVSDTTWLGTRFGLWAPSLLPLARWLRRVFPLLGDSPRRSSLAPELWPKAPPVSPETGRLQPPCQGGHGPASLPPLSVISPASRPDQTPPGRKAGWIRRGGCVFRVHSLGLRAPSFASASDVSASSSRTKEHGFYLPI